MPSEKVERRLHDMLDNIARIRRHVGDDVQEALRDEKTFDAVERCLERIAEAARKIGPRFDDLYPQARLSSLRKSGSVLRHDYDMIASDLIRNAVVDYLPALEDACQHALAHLEPE